MTLKRKLQQVLNVYGEDTKVETPDYILAQFMLDSLKAFDKAKKATEKHRYVPGQENDAKDELGDKD